MRRLPLAPAALVCAAARGSLASRWRMLSATSMALLSLSAQAEVGDALKLLARYELLSDSNLFRLPQGSRPADDKPRSERIGISTAGLVFDKQYSLQRVQLNTSVVHYRHQNFGYLDFTALNYDANWSWSITPRVHGTLVATRRQAANSFSDVRNITQRNVRTDNSLRLDMEGELGAGVRLLGGLDQFRASNEETLEQEKDSQTRNAYLGARYVFRSGNAIGYRYRQGQGHYLNRDADTVARFGDKFDVTEHQVRANWDITGKTSLNARLAYLDLRHSGPSDNDFAEPIGELGLRWKPTAKLTLDAIVAREVRAYQSDYSTHWVGRRFILAPSWAATAHTSLQLRLQQFEQDYVGGSATAGLTMPRRDTTRAASVSVDWRPRNSMSLRLWLQTERRHSSLPGFEFRNHSASLAGQFTF